MCFLMCDKLLCKPLRPTQRQILNLKYFAKTKRKEKNLTTTDSLADFIKNQSKLFIPNPSKNKLSIIVLFGNMKFCNIEKFFHSREFLELASRYLEKNQFSIFPSFVFF